MEDLSSVTIVSAPSIIIVNSSRDLRIKLIGPLTETLESVSGVSIMKISLKIFLKIDVT